MKHDNTLPGQSGQDPPEDLLGALIALESEGIHLLKQIHHAELSQEQLMVLGIDKTRSARLISAATTFWKPVRRRKLQEQIHRVAAEKRLPLDALVGISVQFRQLIFHERLVPTEILAQLINDADGPTVQIIDKARETIKQVNRETRRLIEEQAQADGTEPNLPKPQLTGGREEDARGQRHLVLSDDAREIAAIERALTPDARRLMRKNSRLTLQEARAIVAKNRLINNQCSADCGHENNDRAHIGSAAGPVQALVVMREDSFDKLREQRAEGQVFGSTDGTTITDYEIAQHGLSDKRYVQIAAEDGTPIELYETHPEEVLPILTGEQRQRALDATLRPVPGSINQGRKRRAINTKQRIIASAMTLVCPWPGCTVGANLADGHHLIAWANGGPTDQDNIAMVCKHHNGANDDDRTNPTNGHLFMKDWEIYYQPKDPAQDPIPQLGPLAGLTSVALAKSLE